MGTDEEGGDPEKAVPESAGASATAVGIETEEGTGTEAETENDPLKRTETAERREPAADIDDRITTAACSSSAYERAWVRRRDPFGQSIPRKLAYQALLLTALAGIVPIVALYPPSVAALFPADPIEAAPRAALLGALAIGVELLTATALVVVALVRLRWEPAMTDARATHLLNVEAVASLLGLGTGGVAVAATNGFFALGLAGERAVSGFGELGGNHPFTASGTDLSVAAVAALALAGALALTIASRYVSRRWADAGLA
jgi:hypothetical protein